MSGTLKECLVRRGVHLWDVTNVVFVASATTDCPSVYADVRCPFSCGGCTYTVARLRESKSFVD